jgi:phosphohistidine swiveling domain-containing protein
MENNFLPQSTTLDEINRKYSLDKREWVHKGFHGVLHYFFSVGEQALKPMQEYYGQACSITAFFLHDNFGEWYWEANDLRRLRNWFLDQMRIDPTFLEKFLQDWEGRLRTFDAVMERIDDTNFSALSDDELLKLYGEWHHTYLQEYGISIAIQDAFSMQADEFLIPHFEKIIAAAGKSEKTKEYLEILFSPIVFSFINQEYQDRLRLILQLSSLEKLNNQDLELLARHAKKYCWINNNYAKDLNLGIDHFFQEIKSLKNIDPDAELKEADKLMVDLLEKKRALAERLKLDDWSKLLIHITETFAYVQDERKKYVLMSVHYMRLFLEEFMQRLNLTKEEAEYIYIYELPELFKNRDQINREIFHERKKYVGVFNTLDGYEIFTGQLAQEVFDKYFALKKLETVIEIKGLPASKGVARGKVKVIKKIHDLINMQQDDILVASMTRPEYVPAMKKAAAIVTDEGGITCHAAIVARELQKPCIIGTKIATKVLRDGDLVEVDAENGLVKILSK